MLLFVCPLSETQAQKERSRQVVQEVLLLSYERVCQVFSSLGVYRWKALVEVGRKRVSGYSLAGRAENDRKSFPLDNVPFSTR